MSSGITHQSLKVCEEGRCDGDVDNNALSYCATCMAHFCDPCWDKTVAHRSKPTRERYQEHEKTDELMFLRMRDCLYPPTDQVKLLELHEDDEESTWFGISRDVHDDSPIFRDSGHFETLLAGSSSLDNKVKWPQLVSFVGQTKAGKSTLIKMLITTRDTNEFAKPYPTPVVGSPHNDGRPTSADVHLYADPDTFKGQRPLLYADCEGLDAGEESPFAISSKRSKLNQERKNVVRRLKWADTDRTQTRHFAVKELYPRLLYTFSDVVCFILRNTATFQTSALENLLEWGSVSLEKSINQPVLPHAIIVVNASDLGIDEAEWDVKDATAKLLSSVKNALGSPAKGGVPSIIAHVERWKGRKTINNVEDLIHCYYSSFTVVRLPAIGSYRRLEQQIIKLHKQIAKCCDLSYNTKRSSRMLSTSDQLNVYLQAAFDHFSNRLDKPFNFMEVSLKNKPIPSDFGDHVLQCAITIQKFDSHKGAEWIFEQLASLVASCVLLDCVRFRSGLARNFLKEYEKYFAAALREFCHAHWPCGFSKPKGRKGKEMHSCINMSSGHQKGHQDKDGVLFAEGSYHSSFTPDLFEKKWTSMIANHLDSFQEELTRSTNNHTDPGKSDVQIMQQCHLEHLEQFFQYVPSLQRFRGHSSCFCCLMRVPSHPLPCGHVLCTDCIKLCGQIKHHRVTWEMTFCPLHQAETQGNWTNPWIIKFKPDFAGVRLLTLDGGGIRGIVELVVLKEIENLLGGEIPLRAFFDLIVGTSTGGIIALALGVKRWSLEMCINEFMSLCDAAFTPRDLNGIWVLGKLEAIDHGSIYKTGPLYTALKQSLKEDYLFGGLREDDHNFDVNVAVTATDEFGLKATVMANYSRTEHQQQHSDYEFLRSENATGEFRVWEAAAATSAAPPYFKSFRHPNGRSFFDGALYNNNPVNIAQRERKLLWTDVKDQHPDVLLSVGTGQDKDLAALNDGTKIRSKIIKERPKRNDSSRRALIKVAHGRLVSILDAERSWFTFLESIGVESQHNSRSANGSGRRYIRINPTLFKVPKLDAKGQLENLRDETLNVVKSSACRKQIENTAYRLIASTFYYERTSPTKTERGGFYCEGRICCRFDDNLDYMRKLGNWFMKQQNSDFQPFFEIRDSNPGMKKKLVLTEKVIGEMYSHAKFDVHQGLCEIETTTQASNVTINLHLWLGDAPRAYPISGFPRRIMDERVQSPIDIPTKMVSTPRRSYDSFEDRESVLAELSADSVQTGLASGPSYLSPDVYAYTRNLADSIAQEDPIRFHDQPLRSKSSSATGLRKKFSWHRRKPSSTSASSTSSMGKMPETESFQSSSESAPVPTRHISEPWDQASTLRGLGGGFSAANEGSSEIERRALELAIEESSREALQFIAPHHEPEQEYMEEEQTQLALELSKAEAGVFTMRVSDEDEEAFNRILEYSKGDEQDEILQRILEKSKYET